MLAMLACEVCEERDGHILINCNKKAGSRVTRCYGSLGGRYAGPGLGGLLITAPPVVPAPSVTTPADTDTNWAAAQINLAFLILGSGHGWSEYLLECRGMLVTE